MNKISYKEIALSPEFSKFINSGLTSLMAKHNRTMRIPIELCYDESSDITAYTDSKKCVVNCGYPLFWENATEREFMYRILGVTFHEFGHVLYTDFLKKKEFLIAFKNGILPKPSGLSKEEEKWFFELSETLKGNSPYPVNGVREAVINIFCAINNSVEDGRIEKLLHENDNWFAGYLKGLDSLNKAMRETFTDSIQEDIPGYMNCILEYAKFGQIHDYSGGFKEVDLSIPTIDKMLNEKISSVLMEDTIRLILSMWGMLKDLLLNLPENEATEKVQEISEQANKISESEKTAEIQENIAEIQENAAASESERKPRGRSGSSQEIGSLLKEIKESVKEVKKYNENCEMSSAEFSNATCNVYSKTRNLYSDSFVDEELKIARIENKQAIRQILRYLEEDCRTRISKRKYSGKKFHAEKLVNRDFRYFENASVEKEVPQISVGIVLDQSGSMCGEKANAATKTIIRLYQLLESVPNIDLAIVGHNDTIYQYMAFGEKPKNAVYAFSEISKHYGSCNTDAPVISGMSSILKLQDSGKKIEFIISDGIPNSSSCDKTAKEEIQEVLKENRKLGISTFALAIVSSERAWKQFQDIYNSVPIIKIDNPSDLPKKMVQIVKRYV